MTDTNTGWGAPEPTGQPMQHDDLAGFWIRFLAHVCDGINILPIVLAFDWVALAVGGNAKSTIQLLGAAAGIYMQARWTGERGGTPLRVRTGVLVVDRTDGSFIGIRRAIVRVLMSYVSQFALLLGYFWMLWDRDKQTWHDKVAGSVVVRR